jgi:hypothetical protein
MIRINLMQISFTIVNDADLHRQDSHIQGLLVVKHPRLNIPTILLKKLGLPADLIVLYGGHILFSDITRRYMISG